MDNRLAVRDLPISDQPRYRALHMGLGALSNIELLQLICRTPYIDPNTELMVQAGSLLNLARMTEQEMTHINGMGESGAIAIKAAFELGRRLAIEACPHETTIRSPTDAAMLLIPKFGHLDQEHFIVILLDTRNKILGTHVLYKGTVNSCHIRASEVFREPIRRNAAAIIIAHNHPSGDPTPSPDDVALTKQIVAAGQTLNLEVLDHIVISPARFVSMRERSLGF